MEEIIIEVSDELKERYEKLDEGRKEMLKESVKIFIESFSPEE